MANEIAEHVAITATSQPKAIGFLVSFFEHFLLPVLPSVLLQLAPQIQSNPTLQRVLADTRVVIDQIAPASN